MVFSNDLFLASKTRFMKHQVRVTGSKPLSRANEQHTRPSQSTSRLS